MLTVNNTLLCGLGVVLLAGCSNAKTASTSPLPPPLESRAARMKPATARAANVTFSIAIAAKAKPDRIVPNYVSPATQSLRILTDGVDPLVVNITPSSPDCSPNPVAPGAYVCTAGLWVPAGNHAFTVTTYDATDGTGNVLSTNVTGAVDVKAAGITTVPIVLEGVVGYVILVLATSNPPVGTPVSIGLTTVLEDADQNLIVGSAPYAHPVTLTTSDALDGALSKSVLQSPADAAGITVHYTGASVASISYAATATGLSARTTIAATLTPGASPNPQHLYVTDGTGGQTGTSLVQDFALADPAAAPTLILGGAMSDPWGVAANQNGLLYVVNATASSVSVFDTAHGNAALPPITGGGLDAAGGGIAVGADGKLYVANDNFEPGGGQVVVFDTAHGNAVLPAIPVGNPPSYLAVDSTGKLFVTSLGTNNVLVFDTAHGDAPLPTITGGGLALPTGLAVDASGKLYVANLGLLFVNGRQITQVPNISVFDTAHGNVPLQTITAGGLSFPEGVAIDGSGKLYVANPVVFPPVAGSSTVSVFDTTQGVVALPPIVSGGNPWGLAVH